MGSFDRFHPITLAIYFLSVLIITMFTNNPVLILLAVFGAILFNYIIEKKNDFFKSLIFYLVMFEMVAITNPLFSHNGVTILFFINGNAITFEAVLYGLDIAAMLLAVMYWFKSFNIIMTTDKLLYLFGKLSPKIALVLSLTIRFIPLLKKQAKTIYFAQKTMGLYGTESWVDKLRSLMRTFSALVTWVFENAIDTGASMKGRGYGLKRRTHFSIFQFNYKDIIICVIIMLIDILIFISMVNGKLRFLFYPRVSELEDSVEAVIAFICFGILCFLPVLLELIRKLEK